MPLTVTEKQVRDAYRHVVDDDRWEVPYMERFGTSYSRCGDMGVGYQFPHCRTIRGKVKYNENEEGWFICLAVNGHHTNVRIGVSGKSDYADVASAIEQIIEIV